MFVNRLEKLCDINNKKITRVLIDLGISKGSVSRWKEGAIPNGETLLKIAKYFDVSTDYLLGLTDNPHPTAPPQPQKSDLAQEIEMLSEKDRELIMHIITKMKQEQSSGVETKIS